MPVNISAGRPGL
ncbi:L,D-transpeptidase ErfK [Salmonella enterica subsp. enterica serovar Typhimurium]|nr:L,D-transpeptidase ErfK [Salmonella enterica subsp. enterica serovar Typhimurium]